MQPSAFWFERMGGDLVPHHLIATDVASFPEVLPQRCVRGLCPRRPIDAGPPDRACPDRMRGARILIGVRMEGVSADWQRVASRFQPGSASPTGYPNRSSPLRPRPRAGHDINISEAEAGRLVGAPLIARLKALTSKSIAAAPSMPNRRASSSRTPSSSSAWPAEAPVRRSAERGGGRREGGAGRRRRSADRCRAHRRHQVLTPDSSRFWP